MMLTEKEDATNYEQEYCFLVPLFNSILLQLFRTAVYPIARFSASVIYIANVHNWNRTERSLQGTQLFRRGEADEKCCSP